MFGDNLKKVRKAKGLTQKGLAELVGTTQQNIANYENDYRVPKISTIQLYADSLGVPLSELLPFEEGLSLWKAEKKDFPMTSKEQKIIDAYRHAPIHIQQSVLKLLDME